ncbi:MAG: hypothetical protein MK101_12310, partial [Phycisphaerales bacterium]|nr:hypothetical protein [Phycisphaerales bacterium]
DYDAEGFSVLAFEGSFDGRYDLSNMARALTGAFVEGGIGWALELYDYDLPGVELGEDTFDQLLMRFEVGTYLATDNPYGGEVSVYYDHRKDDFAAGYSFDGIGVGAVGSVGLSGVLPLSERFALDLDAQYGSAVIVGASVRYRTGVAR